MKVLSTILMFGLFAFNVYAHDETHGATASGFHSYACADKSASLCAHIMNTATNGHPFNTIEEGKFSLTIISSDELLAKNLNVQLWMPPNSNNDFAYKYDSGAAHEYSMTMGHGSATLKLVKDPNVKNKFYVQNAWFHTPGFWQIKVSFVNGTASYDIDLPVEAIINTSTNSDVAGSNNNDPRVRISTTGAKFVHDNSYSELGENAYRDPSGLIWGSVVVPSQPLTNDFFSGFTDRSKYMDAQQGSNYCKSIGATLPSEDNFLLLANFLGAHTAKTYNPLQANGDPVLPGGTDNYWTSTRFPGWFTHTIYFHGWFGEVRGLSGTDTLGIRCVKQL